MITHDRSNQWRQRVRNWYNSIPTLTDARRRTTDQVRMRCSSCDWSFASLDPKPRVEFCESDDCKTYRAFVSEAHTDWVWLAVIAVSCAVVVTALLIGGSAP